MAATRQDSDGVHDSRPGSASSRRMASAWPGGMGFPFFFSWQQMDFFMVSFVDGSEDV